jgi:hypothetical protein
MVVLPDPPFAFAWTPENWTSSNENTRIKSIFPRDIAVIELSSNS